MGSEVFCDWVDVTCSPEESFVDDVLHYFSQQGDWSVAFEDDDRVYYKYHNSSVTIDQKKRYHRVSLSGGALAWLRRNSDLDNFLFLLGSYPHTVTRLDAALDVPIDAPLILRGLEDRYPLDSVNLTRKSSRVTRVYSARESDGKLTGTWYVGHRSKARVSARVYDKLQERIDKGDYTLALDPIYSRGCTRYELTFRKDIGCTLRDVSMPSSLFYQYATPTLIAKAPEGTSEWNSKAFSGWVRPYVAPEMTLSEFRRKLDHSPELRNIASLASQFGDTGLELLVASFRNHITQSSNSKPLQGSLDRGASDDIAS